MNRRSAEGMLPGTGADVAGGATGPSDLGAVGTPGIAGPTGMGVDVWWMRLGRYGLGQWRSLLLILGCIVLTVAMDVLRPWPLKLIIDNVLEGEALPAPAGWLESLPGGASRPGLLAWLTLGTIVLFLVGWLGKMVQQYLQVGAGARMVYALSADVFRHLQRMSLRFHGRQPTGDLVKRVTSDTGCVRELVVEAGLPLVTSLVTLASMLGVMWNLDAALAMIALGVAPLLGVCIWFFAGPMNGRSYAYYACQGVAMARAEQTLTALPLVRAFAQEDREQRRLDGAWRDSDSAYLRLTSSQLQFKVGTGTVSALGTAAVLAFGGFRVLSGDLTVGGLVVVLSYVASLYAPLETLAYLSTNLASAAAGAKRVFEVFDRAPEVTERPGARVWAGAARHGMGAGHIRFEGVTFGYEPGRPVLRDLDLEGRPGETIALVGASGAGKSTVLALIPRLYDPWEGHIALDGVDLRELTLASLRRQISTVLQDPFLLPLSVAENIAYARPAASRDEVVRAAVAAQADEFIRQLPQGYDTVIGERGATLSGGQRQRLAIARALLKDAPVLILDEPTSALDGETESVLLEGMYRLMEGRTTILIAHRWSTVRRATRVCVLEGGRSCEGGTHDELLARSGVYRRLSALQCEGGAT